MTGYLYPSGYIAERSAEFKEQWHEYVELKGLLLGCPKRKESQVMGRREVRLRYFSA